MVVDRLARTDAMEWRVFSQYGRTQHLELPATRQRATAHPFNTSSVRRPDGPRVAAARAQRARVATHMMSWMHVRASMAAMRWGSMHAVPGSTEASEPIASREKRLAVVGGLLSSLDCRRPRVLIVRFFFSSIFSSGAPLTERRVTNSSPASTMRVCILSQSIPFQNAMRCSSVSTRALRFAFQERLALLGGRHVSRSTPKQKPRLPSDSSGSAVVGEESRESQ
jgi:hypothetical protein